MADDAESITTDPACQIQDAIDKTQAEQDDLQTQLLRFRFNGRPVDTDEDKKIYIREGPV